MDDLISRDSLINKCLDIINIEWNGIAAPVSWADAYERFVDELEEAPAVNAAPVRLGRWNSEGRKIRCSVCAHRVYLGTDDEGVHLEEKANFKYCPNCGADMREEKEIKIK